MKDTIKYLVWIFAIVPFLIACGDSNTDDAPTDDFDVRFGETFYDGTWFDGVDQADLLSRIACPTVYLKAKTNYGEDGTLLAANSDEDAARVQQLVAVCETVVVESGHDIHYEHPDAFAKAVNEAAGKSSGRR